MALGAMRSLAKCTDVQMLGLPEFRTPLSYSLVHASDGAGYSVESEPSNSLAISPTEAIRSGFDSCGVFSPNS